MNAPDSQTEVFPLGQPALFEPIRTDWLDELPPEADVLRGYQRVQVEAVARELRAGYQRILVQLSCGGGKTHEIAVIVAAAVRAGIPVLICATRTRLVRQIHERLEAFGIRHGVIAAKLPEFHDYSAKVQVASVATLYERAFRSNKHPKPPAGLVLFDEAHQCTARTRLEILDGYPDAIRIGFTATPSRKNGKPLGAAFDCLILGPSDRVLTAAGVLVGIRIFNTPLISAKELKALPKDNENDYQAAALSQTLNKPVLIGNVLENWLCIAGGKRTMVFAVDKAHGAALLEAFLRAGTPTEMVTDDDDEDTREKVVGRLERGETQVVINCFLLVFGVDVPSVEVVVLARPTRSIVMFLQMVGRGRRPSSETGKGAMILIDHGRVVENLGLPQSDFGWTLKADSNVNAEAVQNAKAAAIEKTRTCQECGALWLTSEQGASCPECGWKPTPRAEGVRVREAKLQEMADPETRIIPSDPRVARFYQEACGDRQRHFPETWMQSPKKQRWAAWCATAEKFKFEPHGNKPGRFWDLPAIPAGIEVQKWCQSRRIRYGRGQKTRAA